MKKKNTIKRGSTNQQNVSYIFIIIYDERSNKLSTYSNKSVSARRWLRQLGLTQNHEGWVLTSFYLLIS